MATTTTTITAVATEPTIHSIFEKATSTWQYIVADPTSHTAVIIDPVLDFDPASSTITTTSADALISLVRENNYTVTRILETHAHADHLTAANYLRTKLSAIQGVEKTPDVCIGKHIVGVQERFAKRYGIPRDEFEGAFDRLLEDGEEFCIGELRARAIHLPGHTPDHMGYKIGSNLFCGDSLFNTDVGSARCDFPGGNATHLYSSVRTKILALPADTHIWTGHDYPPGSSAEDASRSEPLARTTVEEQRKDNKHLRDGVSEDEFVGWRRERDAGLGEPRLLHAALQINVRAGRMPRATEGGDRLLHLPVKMKGAEW